MDIVQENKSINLDLFLDNIDVYDLIDRISISEYISFCLGIDIEGKDIWINSPLNSKDINPSFHIVEDKHVFYDFSTHQGGNVLTFTMLYYHLNYSEGIKRLCSYLKNENIAIVKQLSSFKEIQKYKFPKKEGIQTYKKLDDNIMDLYDTDWEKLRLWENEGISKDILLKYQVKYDLLNNRIVFPVFDVFGNIINISGRTMDVNYKDKGIRKYTYYYKLGILDTLYNYCNIKKREPPKEILIFEGVKSVLLCETWGIKNSIALFTSSVNEYQFKLLVGIKLPLVFALDEDKNILQDKRIRSLKNFANVSYIWNYNKLLKSKQSPVDNGKEVFLELYNNKKILY